MARIPSEHVSPIVRRYLAESAPPPGSEGSAWSSGDIVADPLETLASEAGVLSDTLYRILTGRIKTVRHSTVDSLLCAMNSVHLWYEEPLCDFYMLPDDHLWARQKDVPDLDRLARGSAFCRNGHRRTQENTRIDRRGKSRDSLFCVDCARGAKARIRARRSDDGS